MTYYMYYIVTKAIFLHLFDFMLLLFYFSGPIATFLMNHMSHRKVALLGAVLSSAGLIAMPFAPNLVYMYGFYGVLSGNKKKEAHIIKYQFICVCTLFSLCQQLITDKMHFIFFLCYTKQKFIRNAAVSN